MRERQKSRLLSRNPHSKNLFLSSQKISALILYRYAVTILFYKLLIPIHHWIDKKQWSPPVRPEYFFTIVRRFRFPVFRPFSLNKESCRYAFYADYRYSEAPPFLCRSDDGLDRSALLVICSETGSDSGLSTQRLTGHTVFIPIQTGIATGECSLCLLAAGHAGTGFWQIITAEL